MPVFVNSIKLTTSPRWWMSDEE